MLTVKHIGLSGSEELYQTPTIRYSPGSTGLTDTRSYEPATLWIEADGHEIPLTGGTIFVMNDNGKTVARYNLTAPDYRDPEQPSFAEFSREKDGGMSAEAVEILRRPVNAMEQAEMDIEVARLRDAKRKIAEDKAAMYARAAE